MGVGQCSAISCATHMRWFSNCPSIVRHVVIWKGNRRGGHRESWALNRWDTTLRCADKWRPGPNFEGLDSEGSSASWRLHGTFKPARC
jgi:hypothetical protein